MTAAEKDVYTKRVGEWLQEQAPLLMQKMDEDGTRFLNVIQCSAGWNDAECKVWTDGVRLLSALAPNTETWLPDMLYVKAARRCMGRLVSVLTMFVEQGRIINADTRNSRIANPSEQPSVLTPQPSPLTHLPSPLSLHPSSLNPQPSSLTPQSSSLTPARPRHIDQYVHLLPQKTQEKAANVKGLLRDLDMAREKMRLLMDDPQSGDDARAMWAKTATKLDEKVKAIYKELDVEWDKLVESGRVVVDDLGNARVVEMRNDDAAADTSLTSELSSEQKVRRRELRKFLTDTRRGNGSTRDEHVAKWLENWKEYLTLEPREAAMKDEKILAAMEHYSIVEK